MFLLKSIDLIALIGLFVQTLLAWGFVAIAGALAKRTRSSRAFGDYLKAFVALALALTTLSVRFFRAHEVTGDLVFWADGAWFPTTLYSLYFALKTLFGLYLVRGSQQLADHAEPIWLRRLRWPVVAVSAAIPWLERDVTPLLVLQAPIMIGCAVLALGALRRVQHDDLGLRVVRGALVALAVSWVVHATAALCVGTVDWMRYVLALNSFLDLAVQLALGIGWLLGVLEDSQRRLRAAEAAHTRLRRELERDEQLRALGTLVSGVAHELNNPLTVILGYADLLEHGTQRPKAAKVITEQAERCRGIVRSLSALAGRSAHPLRDVDVRELVDRVARGFALDAGPDAPVVRVDVEAGLRMTADRVGMEQVLTNLIANAVHASPQRGVVVIAATGATAGVVIEVTDAGPGVPVELRARVFEPFFTTKPPGEGTGLGLAIAHAIVRAHGGAITIHDGPRRLGATFRVEIPHATAASEVEHAQEVVSDASERRLLLVDDDPGVRSVVRAQAERRGWSVTEAESAEQALHDASRFDAFDAVLCDLRMPGIGGIGLHDRLQREAPTTLERVVFMTGDLASADSLRFAERCRRPLVAKPLDFDALFATLIACRPAASS
ncbi:MAG: response regulator [Planctomycetes bacterium]|nr:response regulator [Planctomycetota bacterium]